MADFEAFYDTTDDIYDHLYKNYIGPVTEDEVFEDEYPLDRYVSAILWPRRASAEKTLEDVNFEDDVSEAKETILTNAYMPSSMAVSCVTFCQSPLEIIFEYAVYLHSEFRNDKDERLHHRYERKKKKIERNILIPNEIQTITLSDINSQILIQLNVRRILSNNSSLITVSVSNTKQAPNKNIENNESALFQCNLMLSSINGFQPMYQPAHKTDIRTMTNNMLYSHIHNYAYGHGCSVNCSIDVKNVFSISSEFMPRTVLNQMKPAGIDNDKLLYMTYWLNTDINTAVLDLYSFIKTYELWRNRLSKQPVSEVFLKASENSYKNIDICINRLKNGIMCLKEDSNAWISFKYMNESMLMQRIATKCCKADSVKWYPFQLAYILQIIPDICDKNSKYRNTVDLLWFPTGGGKTEAYLGVAAFAIFYRRLTLNTNIDGVNIIMRYTLRLLTIQQFERASSLICACEKMRLKYNIPGGEISIGLWIGSGMTPNHIEDAIDAIVELRKNPTAKLYKGNPFQITKCPCCGSDIDIGGYNAENNHLIIRCNNNPNCDFSKKLPIYLIDDDIYSIRPTLVLSTVDKFARLAWEEKAGALFGGNGILAPSLIIQDELHLISGPLGSLAGVYEIAIDKICKHFGNEPKIIASTATVKNAEEQIRVLYNRDMIQFPPNGISNKDSFFAVEAKKSERPARTYIGLCESGGNPSDLLIKTFALMIYLKRLYISQKKPTDIIDQFFTTVGYFNALKELGSAENMIADRIRTEFNYLITHKFSAEAEKYSVNKNINLQYDELTSRKSAKEIKDILQKLTNEYTNSFCLDYVMASNMLSVGIDVDRLGIMTMYGQPKSNAEYIQATSRVGRSNPGIVLTIYNSMRSRDKSHYEQFDFYHKTFYQYVEATSITSYSVRTIEKALHCAFVAIVRQTIPLLNLNKSAVNFKRTAEIESIYSYIIDRINSIAPDSIEAAKEWLDYYINCWIEKIDKQPNCLVYYDYQNTGCSLLKSADNSSSDDIPAVLNSVRNVDASSDIYIIKR